MKDFLLVASSIITVASVIPYLRDILRGSTKPNIVSWITWSLITGIATAAEISAHENRTAVLTGAAMIATALVVVFGLRHGFVKYTQFDFICQASAIIGIVLWQIFNSPTIAVLASVTIDLIGVLPTLRHVWVKPSEETWQAYGIASFGAVLALFALKSFNYVSLTYPIYIVLINILITTIILNRTKYHKIHA